MLPTCLPVPNGNAKVCLVQYHVLWSYLTQLDYSNILATWTATCRVKRRANIMLLLPPTTSLPVYSIALHCKAFYK